MFPNFPTRFASWLQLDPKARITYSLYNRVQWIRKSNYIHEYYLMRIGNFQKELSRPVWLSGRRKNISYVLRYGSDWHSYKRGIIFYKIIVGFTFVESGNPALPAAAVGWAGPSRMGNLQICTLLPFQLCPDLLHKGLGKLASAQLWKANVIKKASKRLRLLGRRPLISLI